jgi:hypothetical protein
MISSPRNFSEWFAFWDGEEAVSRGATREDFLNCWNAATKAQTEKDNQNGK